VLVNRHPLGRSGLSVSPVAFGGNVFGWTVDEPTGFALLDACVDAGINLIDTADVYSRWLPGHQGGESETLIGNWVARRGQRERVLIATKVGVDMGSGRQGLSRGNILHAVDQSLRRLRTHYIDLYQSHRDDTDTPLEETLGTYAELIKAGKVRAIGASNYSAERLAEALRVSAAHGYPRYESVQPWYNLYDRDKFEGAPAALCAREGLGVISYFSLASGFLTGKYRCAKDLEGRARSYRTKDMLNERGLGILQALDEVAGKTGATPAQISIAWLRAHAVTAPIASATSLEQLRELVGAATLTLTPAAVQRLDGASAWSAAPQG
jgi:aryl-alcohol dehydrogenase-like predicted oxidoreductase